MARANEFVGGERWSSWEFEKTEIFVLFVAPVNACVERMVYQNLFFQKTNFEFAVFRQTIFVFAYKSASIIAIIRCRTIALDSDVIKCLILKPNRHDVNNVTSV